MQCLATNHCYFFRCESYSIEKDHPNTAVIWSSLLLVYALNLPKCHQMVLQCLHYETFYQQTEASEYDERQSKEKMAFLKL